jgi:hypothetical protein
LKHKYYYRARFLGVLLALCSEFAEQFSAHVVLSIIQIMALPSGIYTIENVKYRNWAMLFDANEGDVVAGSSPHANVGEKVRPLEM